VCFIDENNILYLKAIPMKTASHPVCVRPRPVPSANGIPSRFVFLLAILLLLPAIHNQALAQSEPLLGEIILVPYNFSPVGWAECNGQLLSISQNTALFSLLGTTYGGNGVSTFALPDLRDRVPVGAGQGSGLSDYLLGQQGGEFNHTLILNELPAHTHQLNVKSGNGNSNSPGGNVHAANGVAAIPTYTNAAPNATMNPGVIAPAGGSQPHNNMQPYLGLKFIIATQGIFPSRP
jgi:microcystin-dependent protein